MTTPLPGGEFSLREDRNGLRVVFPLGNALGLCPYNCPFCGVKTIERTPPREARLRFNALWHGFRPLLNGPYHPVIYNRGNVTNPLEFPTELLDHVLDAFRGDPRVVFLSVNSREADASAEVLQYLFEKGLSYPLHFILGVETLSYEGHQALGKNTAGELERFIDKLLPFNRRGRYLADQPEYVFGLDVNLVFLPELYGCQRDAQDDEVTIRSGIERDLCGVLSATHPEVPIEINIHPYHRVEALPYADADLGRLIRILPALQTCVDKHNSSTSTRPTHLFVGVEGAGYASDHWNREMQRWGAVLNRFNTTGAVASQLQAYSECICKHMELQGYNPPKD